MRASVIIPTYNRRKVLERTLEGLINQTVPSDAFEIIVVDDCSPDDTEAFMKGKVESTPNLAYIRHVENQGPAATRNDGIVAAHCEVVIFLDDDNIPDPRFVQAHLEYHKQNGDEHIVVMGNVRFALALVAGSNFARYMQSRYLGFRSAQERTRLDYSNLPPRCLGTLNCSMRREDLMAIGMFNTSFRYYAGEDEFLGYCLQRAGIRMLFGEQARSEHYDDLSIQRYKNKIIEVTGVSYCIILEKGPEYFERTQVRFLLPVDWGKDPLQRIVIKLGLRLLLNPLSILMLEQWVILADKHARLYFQTVYRLLMAGWAMRGLQLKQQSAGLVTYD